MEEFQGKVWKLGDDIDTDIILPTEYLVFPTIAEMKPYAFSPLRPELAGKIEPGDIIVGAGGRESARRARGHCEKLCAHLLSERD